MPAPSDAKGWLIITLNGETYQSTILTGGYRTKIKSEQHPLFDCFHFLVQERQFFLGTSLLSLPLKNGFMFFFSFLCKSHLSKTMLKKCFQKNYTPHANKNLQAQSIWTRSVGNSILVSWSQSRWGKWEESTLSNRTFSEARWPNDGSGSKTKNSNVSLVPTSVIIFRSVRFTLISTWGRHNLTLIYFLKSIVILTLLSIYPHFMSAFQCLEAGRTQNQGPLHGQYGRLVANSLPVHLTVDR